MNTPNSDGKTEHDRILDSEQREAELSHILEHDAPDTDITLEGLRTGEVLSLASSLEKQYLNTAEQNENGELVGEETLIELSNEVLASDPDAEKMMELLRDEAEDQTGVPYEESKLNFAARIPEDSSLAEELSKEAEREQRAISDTGVSLERAQRRILMFTAAVSIIYTVFALPSFANLLGVGTLGSAVGATLVFLFGILTGVTGVRWYFIRNGA